LYNGLEEHFKQDYRTNQGYPINYFDELFEPSRNYFENPLPDDEYETAVLGSE
jgi:hypothetical protein